MRPITSGELTRGEAKSLNESQRLAQSAIDRLNAASPPVDGSFSAKLTAYDSGTGYYSWTMQERAGDGTRYNHPNGRTGTTTYDPAIMPNGEVLTTFPVNVWLRPVGASSSVGVVHEVIAPPTTDDVGLKYFDDYIATVTPSGTTFSDTRSVFSGFTTGDKVLITGYIRMVLGAASGNDLSTDFEFTGAGTRIGYSYVNNYYSSTSGWVATLPISTSFTLGTTAISLVSNITFPAAYSSGTYEISLRAWNHA